MKWDSVMPFSCPFPLNHLDKEIFLNMPHLLPNTYIMSGTVGDLYSLRTLCCVTVITAVTNMWRVKIK